MVVRLVFFGTPEPAVSILEAITKDHEIVGVVCQPDRAQGRKKKPVPPPVKVFAESHGQEISQPEKLNDGTFEAWLRGRDPQLCVVAAYGRILKQPILDVPPLGYLNVHPSLLPKYRGPSPIQAAIINGDTVSGMTIMAMDAGMDSGDIVLQREFPIEDEDDGATLSAKLFDLGAEMILEGIRLVESGKAEFEAQDESQVIFSKLMKKEDGEIDWTKSANEIRNLIRGSLPWPAAQTTYKGEHCRILKAHVVDEKTTAEPGRVIELTKTKLVVATGAGSLGIDCFQAPGKRALPIADYLRGASIALGDRFGTGS